MTCIDPSRQDDAATPQTHLLTARIIWGAMLMGVVMLSAVLLLVVPFDRADLEGVTPSIQMTFRAVSVASLVVGVPLALFARGQVFKRHWVADAVTPQGYLTGNIIAWAVCEGAMFISVILSRFDQLDPLYLSVAGVTLVVFILLWPNGKAMLPYDKSTGAVGRRHEKW